jgi:RNA polymerase sigma-70 factor (ECF subfamily)
MAHGSNDDRFKSDLTRLIPHMRAFARSLCGDPADADDLAQDALLKAWHARASFRPGTNLKAWTFMILRNQFYSEKRRSWRRQPLDPEVAERTLVDEADPSAPLELDEVRRALAGLPEEQRDALIMVGAGGLTYEDAAEALGCALGTVKSRVSRARARLAALLAAGAFADDEAPAAEALDSIVSEARALERNAEKRRRQA